MVIEMSAEYDSPTKGRSNQQISRLDLRDEGGIPSWIATRPVGDCRILRSAAVVYLPASDTLKVVFAHECVPPGALLEYVARVTELIQRFYTERRCSWLDGTSGFSLPLTYPAPREVVMPRLQFEVSAAPELIH